MSTSCEKQEISLDVKGCYSQNPPGGHPTYNVIYFWRHFEIDLAFTFKCVQYEIVSYQ